VEKLSSVLLDLALAANIPIVPVRFYGGLPIDPLQAESDFPFLFGTQDYYLGRPILPEELRLLPYGERRRTVLQAINRLGPAIETETPRTGDAVFAAALAQACTQEGLTLERAVFLHLLEMIDSPSKQTQLLTAARHTHKLTLQSGDGYGQWLVHFASWLVGTLTIQEAK
jgi:hypothetical protein